MSNIKTNIPILIGNGVGHYNAGEFTKNVDIKFSTYLPNHFKNEIKNMKSNNTYILGPIYIDQYGNTGDIQIGFTGKQKFKRYNLEPENETKILQRELFEESGLYVTDIGNKYGYVKKNLKDIPAIEDVRVRCINKLLDENEELIDYKSKTPKRISVIVYTTSMKLFQEKYQDTSEFFKSINYLMDDDDIIGVGCIRVADIKKYIVEHDKYMIKKNKSKRQKRSIK